jgi:hypothetical protein
MHTMKKKGQTDGYACDFCPERAADTVYFHDGTKLACEACHARLAKEERERKQTNQKGE